MSANLGQRDPTAVMGRRFVAALIDFLLYAGVYALAFSRLALFVRADGISNACEQLRANSVNVSSCFQIGDRAYFLGQGDNGVLFLLSLAWFIAIYAVLQGLTGSTPGKAIAGVRVVREDGSWPGIGRSLGRSAMWIVDAQPCGIPAVGLITALSSAGHRRVGDMAAKTFVVARESAGSPITVGVEPAPAAYGQPWAPAPAYPATPPEASMPQWPAAAPVAPPPPASPQPAPAPPASAAQWDAARGAYILWEPTSRAWLQWDAASSSWGPIR